MRTPRSEVHVVGGLSRETIRRIIRRNVAQVRHCYEQGLQANPSLTGRVGISWRIDLSGRVQNAQVSNTTLHNSGVETCIATAVRRWSFPAPEGYPVAINYPFVLQTN